MLANEHLTYQIHSVTNYRLDKLGSETENGILEMQLQCY